jgi:hypothetical protein
MRTIYIVLRNAVFAMQVNMIDAARIADDFRNERKGRRIVAGTKSTPTGSVHVELYFTLDEVIAVEIST